MAAPLSLEVRTRIQRQRERRAAETAANAAALAVVSAAIGADARRMVLTDRPRLTSLEDVASRFTTEVTRTDAIHADLQSQITALRTVVSALGGQVSQATTAVAIAVNGTGSLTFNWDTAWADATYRPLLLAPVRVTNIVYAKSSTQCTVTFKYTGTLALGIGTTFNLIGYRLG